MFNLRRGGPKRGNDLARHVVVVVNVVCYCFVCVCVFHAPLVSTSFVNFFVVVVVVLLLFINLSFVVFVCRRT